jgi:hypothetical protein
MFFTPVVRYRKALNLRHITLPRFYIPQEPKTFLTTLTLTSTTPFNGNKCSNLKHFYDLTGRIQIEIVTCLVLYPCCSLPLLTQNLGMWTNNDRAHPDETQEYKCTLIEHTYQMNTKTQECKNSYCSAVGKAKN